MNRPVDETLEATHPTTTVLDRVRPTVVVRRRVYEVPPSPKTVIAHVTRADEGDDDDNGPPSSVNVARALASLRVDELRRLEEIVSADDDPIAPSVPAVPSVRMGATIALADLASGMGVPKQELVTALVTHGFFSVTVKTVLPRETARTAAAMFGWAVVDQDEAVATPAAKLKSKAKPKKLTAKPKPVLKLKSNAKPKPGKKKPARRRP
jgi:hypothetical protein